MTKTAKKIAITPRIHELLVGPLKFCRCARIKLSGITVVRTAWGRLVSRCLHKLSSLCVYGRAFTVYLLGASDSLRFQKDQLNSMKRDFLAWFPLGRENLSVASVLHTKTSHSLS